MTLAAPLVVFAALTSVTAVHAQNAPAPAPNTQAPVIATPPAPTPPAPTPTRGVGSATSITYRSVDPKPSFRVEPVDGQRVRLAGWESSGFIVSVDQGGTRIISEGEATTTAFGQRRVDSVEMEFVEGRAYLTLTNVRP